ARMPQDTEFGIFEIGMNHPGEIAPLAAQVQPHVALVTTVGTAHLEAFDDVDGIAREKAAIYSGLVSDAQCEPTAIVNADLPNTSILMDAARAHAARIHTFGEADGAGYHLKAATLHDDCTVVEATADRRSLLFKIQSPGRHFAANALGVLATAEAMGADPTLSMLGLSRWQPPAGRGTREALLLDAAMEDSVIFLIDDAFNANPTSMAASLDVLAAATPTDQIGRVAKGRRIAVLGEMLELGTEAARLHAQIADHPGIAQLDTVHCVGDLMHNLYTALPDHLRGRWVETAAELASDAHRLIDAGDVVLVKGSKGSQVSRVVDALRKLGHPRGQPDKAE
ncbi:MAG: Mur ligase family protein, partial [Pseudomonadota bacterium]